VKPDRGRACYAITPFALHPDSAQNGNTWDSMWKDFLWHARAPDCVGAGIGSHDFQYRLPILVEAVIHTRTCGRAEYDIQYGRGLLI
jgi:hypothetical protein